MLFRTFNVRGLKCSVVFMFLSCQIGYYKTNPVPTHTRAHTHTGTALIIRWKWKLNRKLKFVNNDLICVHHGRQRLFMQTLTFMVVVISFRIPRVRCSSTNKANQTETEPPQPKHRKSSQTVIFRMALWFILSTLHSHKTIAVNNG